MEICIVANKCFRSEERRKMRGRLNSPRPERERIRDKGSSLVKILRFQKRGRKQKSILSTHLPGAAVPLYSTTPLVMA